MLKKLIFKEPGRLQVDEYPEDVERIVRVFADRGFEVSSTDGAAAWEAFSESWGVGWIIPFEDDEKIFEGTRPYLIEKSEQKLALTCPKCQSENIRPEDPPVGFIEAGEYLEAEGRFEYEVDVEMYRCQDCGAAFAIWS